jgi:hypothetical protein
MPFLSRKSWIKFNVYTFGIPIGELLQGRDHSVLVNKKCIRRIHSRLQKMKDKL